MTELGCHFSNRRDEFLLYLAEKPTQEKTVSEALAEFRDKTPNQLEELAGYWNGALEETAGITFHTNTATFSYAEATDPVEFNSLSRALQLFLNRTGLIFLTLIENYDQPSLILIDEPEAGLSPALAGAFIKIIEELTEGKNAQLVFTTKNPDIAAIAPTSSTFELKLDLHGTRIAKANQESHQKETPEASDESKPRTPNKANFARLKRAIEETDDQDELANLVDELMSLRNL
jgi:predicted ATPase